MAPANKDKGDPTERITKMINDAVEAALGNRDAKEAEAKDPWARIAGIVDRSVAKHFEAFAKALDEEDAAPAGDGKGKRGRDANDDPLSLFG